MDYTLTTCYRWYCVPDEIDTIIKVFCIEHIPYSFDIIPEIARSNPEIIKEANQNTKITADQMFKFSDYLILEQAHPLLFDIKIKNPEELPTE